MPLTQTVTVVAFMLIGQCPSTSTTTTSTTTTTTTSSAMCKTNAGVGVPGLTPDDTIELGAGCANCTCREDGLAQCQMPVCPKLACWDGKTSSPLCCATCPWGRNCKTPGGTVLNETASVIENGKTCKCSNFTCGEGCNGPAATCTPLPSASPTTTTPAPIVCRLQNGTVLKVVENPGVVWKSEDGCRKCSCDDSGKITCVNVTCGVTPSCEDRMNVTGRCCEVCGFDVGICLLASQYQVKMRKPIRMTNGTLCSCRKGKKEMKLNCYLPSARELQKEADKITKILDKLVRLRRKLYRLQNAVIDIDYP